MSPGSREYCPNEIDKCPVCGKQKMAKAKLCRVCNLAEIRKSATYVGSKRRKVPCPDCGEPMYATAKYCRKCSIAHKYQPVTDIPPMSVLLTSGHSIFDEPPKYSKPSEVNDD